MRRTRILVLAGLTFLITSPPVFAVYTPAGKTSGFASEVRNNVAIGTAELASAFIQKGRARTVLAISATLTTLSGTNATFHMFPEVNGVVPYGSVVNQACVAAVARCTMTGTWWLDVDDTEASNPGEFLNQPLSIVLLGGVLSGATDADVTATLSVQMVRK